MDYKLVPCIIYDDVFEYTKTIINTILPNTVTENQKNALLPFWLAKELQKLDLVVLSAPSFISEELISSIEADPVSVKLGTIDKNFYKVFNEVFSEITELQEFALIIDSCKTERFSEIVDRAHLNLSKESKNFLKHLTSNEEKIFQRKVSTEKFYNTWKSCKSFEFYFKNK